MYAVIQNYNFVCSLYGYKTSVTLRKEQRLKVFENWVLREIFGPTRDEVRRQWTRMHEKFYDLHSSPYIIRVFKSRRNDMGEVCGT